MDITQVQEKKDLLESIIEKHINEFEQNTQTTIERVELDKIEVSEFGKPYHEYMNRIHLNVRLKERL